MTYRIKNTLFWCIAALFLLLNSQSVFAQETLRVTFETDETGPNNGQEDFRPMNLVVVWLADSNGKHIATLARWGKSFAHNLRDWRTASDFARNGHNIDGTYLVDGYTEATQRCNTGDVFNDDPTDTDNDGCFYNSGVCGGCVYEAMPTQLDTTAIDISKIPDGSYTIEFELSDWEIPNPTGNARASVTFNKNGTSQSFSGSDQNSFSNIQVNYTGHSGDPPPGVFAGADQFVTPSGAAAVAPLQGVVSDVGGLLSTTWSVVYPVDDGCVLFDDNSLLSTNVNFCRSGYYVLRLTADDGSHAPTYDELVVYVNATILYPTADSYVTQNSGNQNNGSWRFLWMSNPNRGYLRFDTSSVSGTIVESQLKLSGVESIYTDNQYRVRLVDNDSWAEMSITWNNQPLSGGDYNNALLAGGWLPSFGNMLIILDPAVFQDTAATDSIVTFFLGPETSNAEWTGFTSRETYAPPELILIEDWQEINTTPVADAGNDVIVVDADGNGTQSAFLDGSGTSDNENNIVLYQWKEGATVLGSDETLLVSLALGIHDIDLYVEDSRGANHTDSVRVIIDDRNSGNDTNNTPTNITAGSYNNLFAYLQWSSGIESGDWYQVNLPTLNSLDVNISFSHANGNLDLRVFRADGTTLEAGSLTLSDNESVHLPGLSAGDYFINVSATNGEADANVYGLDISVSGAPTLSVTLNPNQADENAGTLTNAGTITVDQAPSSDLTVNLLSDNETDLNVPASVQILTSQTSVLFDIILNDNGLTDNNRIVGITASASGHFSGSANFTIIDEDKALPNINWITASQSVSEADNQIIITANLSDTASSDITIPYTVSGTAIFPDDHDLQQGNIVILNGSSSIDLVINITDDSTQETSETIIVTLGASADVILGSSIVHTITISDNDTVNPTTLSITLDPNQAKENAGVLSNACTVVLPNW